MWAPDAAENASEVAAEAPAIDRATERVAVRLAREIHYQGSIPLTGVELHLSRLNRNLKPAQVLDYAVANGWLELSDDGLRVLPGEVFPSLEDSALRYMPASAEV